MSETITQADRDTTTGRFLPGNSGNGGRKPGSRNKLGEQFIADLRDAWHEHGPTALARCATEEPAQFVRVVASLMPRDIDLTVMTEVNVTTFADQFRAAVALLGNEPPAMRTIEHSNARKQR